MASTADLDGWAAFGGTVEEKQRGKRTDRIYIGPEGQRLRSWKEANALMSNTDKPSAAKKRGQEAPGEGSSEEDNNKENSQQPKKAKTTNEAQDPPAATGAKSPGAAPKTAADKGTGKGKKPAATPAAPKEAEAAAASTEAAPDAEGSTDKPAASGAAQPEAAAAKPTTGKKAPAAKGTSSGAAAAKPSASKRKAPESAKGGATAKAQKAAATATAATATAATAITTAGAADETNDPMEEDKADEPAEDAAATANRAPVGSGRRAAQGISYKSTDTERATKGDKVVAEEEPAAADEDAALKETAAAGTASNTRRLIQFSVVDENGVEQPLDRVHLVSGPLTVTGCIYPEAGPLVKSSGRRLEAFGPLTSWSLECVPSAQAPSSRAPKDAGNGGPKVVLLTPKGRYVASRPLAAYKKVFAGIEEQAALVFEVLQAIDPAFSGSASATLDEVVARLARAKVGRGYGSAREALLLNGRFVLEQLAAHDARAAGGAGAKGKGAAAVLVEGPFAKGLEAEFAKGPIHVGMTTGNAITIRDAADAPAAKEPETEQEKLVAADEEMARRMQAKMDAEAYGGGGARSGVRGGGRGRGSAGGGSDAYIRMSEEEIADDYPMPRQYEKVEDETDELLLWDEELAQLDPEDLPKRRLTNFAIYNAEGFFASLELLPMWSGVDPDAQLFASGVVLDDDGDWELAGGQAATDEQLAAAGDAGAGGSGASAEGTAAEGAAAAAPDTASGGMRLFLSQIKEWVVEFSCDMLFISIRTDAAWYRLDAPMARYAPWFKVPLKAARLAVKIIGLLDDQKRAARLSFADVVKQLAGQADTSPTFISKKPDRVERFVVVHGQVILNQVRHFPKQAVQRAQFVGELKGKMAMRRHSKLYYAKKGAVKAGAVNRNPMKDRTSSRPKPMPATATRMVKSIWQNYFSIAEKQAEQDAAAAAAAAEAAAAGTAQEVEEDPNEEEQEEEEDNEETALAEEVAAPQRAKKAATKKSTKAKRAAALKKGTWVGAATSATSGRTLYAKAKVGDLEVSVGDVVAVAEEDEGEEEEQQQEGGPLGLVQCMWQDEDGDKRVQLRTMHRGCETVLGDAASGCELFVGQEWEEAALGDVTGLINAKRLARAWDPDLRARHFAEDEALRARNEELAKNGQPLEFFYRHLYKPEEGMFCALPQDLNLGSYIQPPAPPAPLAVLPKGAGFTKEGVEYLLGSCLFVHPDTFDVGAGAAAEAEAADANVPEYAMKRGGQHKGSTFGLRAFGVAKLLEVQSKSSSKASSSKDAQAAVPMRIKVQRFYRPEDVSRQAAYEAGLGDVYAPGKDDEAAVQWINMEDVIGPCVVTAAGAPYDGELHRFIVTHTYDATSSQLTSPPAEYAAGASAGTSAAAGSARAAGAAAAAPSKGKGKAAAPNGKGPASGGSCGEGAEPMDVDGAAEAAAGKGKAAAAGGGSKGKGAAVPEAAATEPAAAASAAGTAGAAANDGLAMATMDIFAGCGGLSEGMHQAGVAASKWAIEYEAPAADAFKLNNPGAEVFCANCNVILRAAMDKAGLADDCMAHEEAVQQAGQMPADRVAALPLPGQVEFIMGGPPCQGYSGMNRFNKGNWSMVQNSMVMAFLSFADFYRPRYFLLENVRNFVSHNKSFTFRMTLRTLLDMGYQVRFGVLNAGNYGVPQSRKRTFIWAAAPDERLPTWPQPLHVFRSPQLTINLPGGVQYTAVPEMPGAPLRTVIVKDAIGDLPAIENGESRDVMEYSGPPISAFQKAVRGECSQLRDHICKEMNELNLERCRCIPKNAPGADWRVLQEIVAKDPSRKQYKGQDLVPWCLPNTADRHNGWRGLFGRVDLHGHFPTSTTDPQPMGKVGQVFHPEQDRIMSVRECARSQGFPDRFHLSGNVHNRHRQVGNAVPPPLAAALGRELHKALQATQRERIAALLQC